MPLDNAAVNSRLVIILVIIVGLISAVGVIISAVALGRPSAPDVSISTNNHPISLDWFMAANAKASGGSGTISKRDLSKFSMHYSPGGHDHQAKTVWTLAMGYDNGAHDYRSEEGRIQGFGHDLVEAVCATMGIECRVVFDRYQNCWTSTPHQYSHGGQGLLGQWYDACVGWSPNQDRMNVFDFSPSYTEATESKLYVSANRDQKLSDTEQGTIGFIRGFVDDEQCLNKGKQQIPGDDVVYADTPRELVALLTGDKVSAIFSNSDVLAPYIKSGDVMEVAGHSYRCADDGYAVMTRKDSTFTTIWNEGFNKLKKSGAFKNICDDVQKLHGNHGTIKCIEE